MRLVRDKNKPEQTKYIFRSNYIKSVYMNIQ